MTFAAGESPDWGYARTRRTVLMTTSAEWSQAVFSCPFESQGKRLIAPNRDSPYEGLFVHQDGENWKFIDCIAVALRQGDDTYVPLAPVPGLASVWVDPWRVTYEYRARVPAPTGPIEVPVRMSYYLASQAADHSPLGCVTIYIPRDSDRRDLALTLLVQPFLDIRHMYSGMDLGACRIHLDERGLLAIATAGREIVFYLPPGRLSLMDAPELLSWRYKLGTGTREEVLCQASGRMETRFVAENRQVAAFFALEAPIDQNRVLRHLSFQCGPSRDCAGLPATAVIRGHLRQARRRDREHIRTIESAVPLRRDLPMRNAILGRIVGLTKFKTFVHGADGRHAKVPNAGGWWFKTPWYRDVFEGILSSFETLMRLPEERANVRGVIDLALSSYNESNGLIMARVPELKSDSPPFNSSDATLLCLLTAHTYASCAGDLELGRLALARTLQTVARFREHPGAPQSGMVREGPPRLDPDTGLLLCAPHHSWIDTHTRIVGYAGWSLEGIPNRASASLAKDLYDRLGSKQAVEAAFSSARFYLPEINAQWISVLSASLATFELVAPGGSPPEKAGVTALAAQARAHYKPVFWNPKLGFLFNLVHESREVYDAIECEAAITAAALLGTAVFTMDELRSIWSHAEKTLLVHRTLQLYGDERLPFGLLTRLEDQRIYYGDDQYHADVIWPRSTPYLIRLLELLGESQTVRDLLVNNLDHQMSETALFYNQELFSRPCGNNPAPDEKTSNNPVPVKNPIQFWSQWCDGYTHLRGERHE